MTWSVCSLQRTRLGRIYQLQNTTGNGKKTWVLFKQRFLWRGARVQVLICSLPSREPLRHPLSQERKDRKRIGWFKKKNRVPSSAKRTTWLTLLLIKTQILTLRSFEKEIFLVVSVVKNRGELFLMQLRVLLVVESTAVQTICFAALLFDETVDQTYMTCKGKNKPIQNHYSCISPIPGSFDRRKSVLHITGCLFGNSSWLCDRRGKENTPLLTLQLGHVRNISDFVFWRRPCSGKSTPIPREH